MEVKETLFTNMLSYNNKVAMVSSFPALVGSLTIGTMFLLSPVAGILTDRIGIRVTTFIGGIFAFVGLFISSFFYDKVGALYLTYGVMYGIGASLAYTPSLVILGHYFQRYMGIVNGFVTAGSSTFTMIMPYVIDALLQNFGLNICLRILSLTMCLIMVCALLFKPVPLNTTIDNKKKFSSLINRSIWQNKRYVAWALILPMSLFGYFVLYVHMAKFVEDIFPNHDAKNLVFCIGVASCIGRLIFGRIADNPKINRVLMQQLSLFFIGGGTMLMTFSPNFGTLILIVLIVGLFDGCFISVLGPVAFDLCGQEGAGQAIGFLLGFCSLPLTVGPPIAGLLYDHTKSYRLSFLLAGVPPIIGGLLLFFVSMGGKQNNSEDRESAVASTQLLQRGNDKPIMANGHSGKQDVSSSGDNHNKEESFPTENKLLNNKIELDDHIQR